MRKNKIIAHVHTKEGMPIKVWANQKTGVVLPSNWKQQAGFLAGPVEITKRLANRHRRNAARKALDLAAYRDRQRMVGTLADVMAVAHRA